MAPAFSGRNMDNTEGSFRDKWERNEQLSFEQTVREGYEINRWILSRNGFTGNAGLRSHLEGRRRILDAGCGNGRVTALLRECSSPATTQVVGIDLVAADVARRNLARYENVEVRQADLLGDLSGLGSFDFIYCQEVLHHTADPRRAFENLCSLLDPAGEIAIYVYKRKAPVREFVDDYVRERIAGLPYEDAIKVCEEITALGKTLADLRVEVNIPQVTALGIPAGRYDLQRFVYHFFMKCFWNPELAFGENAVINYDWYHPQLCSRHTLEEVRTWFERAGIRIVHECVDFYGITIRGCRR
jgi:SAM-dependent methyltransferase